MSLCPFFKTDCYRDKCVMWKNGCLITIFLDKFQLETTEAEIQPENDQETSEKSQFKDWLEKATPANIAEEIIEFKNQHFSNERVSSFDLTRLFWTDKELDNWEIPAKVQLKIEQANLKVQQKLDEIEEAKNRKRLAEEKQKLSTLIKECIDWTNQAGLKKLTLADVDAFILDKNLDIMFETRRALYSKVNIKLKVDK